MKKKIVLNFAQDKLSFTIGYFFNTILILLYVYSLGSQIDIVYPFLLSIVVYVFLILSEWVNYYKFNRNLTEGIENRYFSLNPKTREQLATDRAIFKIHEAYTSKLSTVHAQNTDNKYFLSQWIHNIKTPTSIFDLIIQKATKETNFDSQDFTINQRSIVKLFFDIREENNKVKNDLDQILTLSRLNDFSKDYEPQSVDLVSLLKEVINSKKSQFIYNNVFPKIEFKYEQLLIVTDKKWNKFMLEQIIGNAIKYSGDKNEKKSIHFNIYIDGEGTRLSIRDEGIGIPSYDIKRVFEPFFTGENGRKIGDATGIGLYICKIISKKLNHKIAIESEVHKGTTFSIIYPSKI